MAEHKNPLLSVIVPVYNVEDYLCACLDSLVNQTEKNIEIITVNDGSTDNSPAILTEYERKYRNIRVINQSNAGLSAARNTGIAHSRGEYIGFLDSDDFADHYAYKILLSVARDRQADIVKCRTLIFRDADSTIVDLRWNPELNIISDTPFMLLKTYFQGDMNKVVWDGIYKSTLFRDLQFPVGRKFEDHYYTPNALFRCKRYVQIPDTLFYYRKRKGAITDTGDINGKADKLQSLNEIYRIIQNTNFPDRLCSLFSEYVLKMCREYHNSLIYTSPWALSKSSHAIDNLIETEVFKFILTGQSVSSVTKHKINQMRRSHLLFFASQKTTKLFNLIFRSKKANIQTKKADNDCSDELMRHYTNYLRMYA